MNGQVETQEVRPAAAQMPSIQASRLSSAAAVMRVLALLMGAAAWFFAGSALLSSNGFSGPEFIFVAPPLAWGLPLFVLLLNAHRWVEALWVVVVFPIAVFANTVVNYLLLTGLKLTMPDSPIFMMIVAAVLAPGWLALGVMQYRSTVRPESVAGNWYQKSASYVEILLVMLVLVAFFGSFYPSNEGYSTRSRVSELILACSSTKTALSEGIQTYGSWSPTWISNITISPTGMVASASIGPAGEIIVRGTKATSHAVVTMTPSITTDNKLLWSCVGTPAKYMPASCR